MFAAAAALMLASHVIAGANPPRHVLLLYSFEREFSNDAFARQFRADLIRSSPQPIDFIEMALQPTPTSRRQPDEVLLDDLRSAFDGRRLDLVVPMGGPAVVFAQRYKDDLFPRTPVLLASVDNRFVRADSLQPDETAVALRHDPPQMIESILRLLPDTQTVVVVVGASPHEAFWVDELKRVFRPFDGRLTFTWTNGWTYGELLRRCAALPPHSVILYGLMLLDADGVPQREEQTLDALHAAANAPVFGLHSPQLGHGIVGGPLMSYEDLSRVTSAVAVRLLSGESARAIPAYTLTASAPTFDARELRRWSIAERRLQGGSIVRFREPAPSRPWLGPAVAGIAIGAMLGFATIFALPRTRLRSTSDGEGNAAGTDAALARLTQRLLAAQEQERASIARWIEDDVCQQLAALSMDLHARGEDALSNHLSALARESLAISDPTYSKLTLLGLTAVARAFAERRCADAGVALEFRASDVPDDLPRDVALALFRVMQEALDNAVRHAKCSRITIWLRRAGDVIALDVVDDGVGLDTTAVAPGDSLGLVAMRERLHRIGGACTIESRPGAGTRVRAFVRLVS